TFPTLLFCVMQLTVPYSLNAFRDKMRRFGRTIPQVKSKHSFFDLSVCFGDPSVLSEMLRPGLHNKGFDEPTRISGVAIQSPTKGSVTSANPFHFAHHVTKLLCAIRIDTILDRNQHRSFIGFGSDCHNWLRPMHPWRETQIFESN